MLKIIGATLIATGLAAGSALAAPVSQNFGLLTSYDTGPSLSATFTGLPANITGDLTIDFAIGGDFNNPSIETFDLLVNGTNFGTACSGAAAFGLPGACTNSAPMLGQLVIGNAVATTLLSGGSLTVTFVGTDEVDPVNYQNLSEVPYFGVVFPERIYSDGVTMDLAGMVSYDAVAAVPLPAALPLAVAGFGLLGFAARRRG